MKILKTLNEYQEEISSMEMEIHEGCSIMACKAEDDEEELENLMKDSFRLELEVEALRDECIGEYGEDSLWPTEQTPGAIGALIVTGVIKLTEVSPWFESDFNTFKESYEIASN